MIIVTGIPGSGKTLFTVDMLRKYVQENKNLPDNEKRNIQANITDLIMEGVEDDPPLDWREAPERSILVYDEAQTLTPFKDTRGLSPFKYVEDLTLHRKGGYLLIYITQDIKRLHSNISEMCEVHYHLVRPFGASASTVYQFRGHERNPNSEAAKSRAENKFLFKHDKKLFDLYKSSNVKDGIKFKLPKKVLFFITLPLLLFAFSAYMFLKPDTQRMVKGGDKEVIESTVTPLSDNLKSDRIYEVPNDEDIISSLNPEYELLEFVTVHDIVSVIFNNNNCIARDSLGYTVDMPLNECLTFSEKLKGYKASVMPIDNYFYDVE